MSANNAPYKNKRQSEILSVSNQQRRLLLAAALAVGFECRGLQAAIQPVNTASCLPKATAMPSGTEIIGNLPGSPADANLDVTIRRAAQSVVRIIYNVGQSGASGLLFGDGWLLTAAHVAPGSEGGFNRSHCNTTMVVSGFDLYGELSARRYYLMDPDYFVTPGPDEPEPRLDYLLVRLLHANAKDKDENWPTGLRAARLPLDMSANECIRAHVIGHPESGCDSLSRNWAYKTHKKTVVHRSRAAPEWELLLSTDVCPGTSGGPVLDEFGDCLGIVSHWEHYGPTDSVDATTLKTGGCVVSLEAIAAHVKGIRPDLKIPGLTDRQTLLVTRSRVIVAPYPGTFRQDGACVKSEEPSSVFEQKRTVPPQHAESERVLASVGLITARNYVSTRDYAEEGAGTCVRVGREWILTAKHVVDSAARASFVQANFNFLRSDTGPDQRLDLLLDPGEYYSSADRSESLNGWSSVLDYALIKLRCPPPSLAVTGETFTAFARAAWEDPILRSNISIPQHQPRTGKGWWKLTKVPTGSQTYQLEDFPSTIVGMDTRRIYYDAAVRGGASGAPVLDDDLRLVAIHTNSRVAACSNPEKYGEALLCAPRRYWEKNTRPPEEEYTAWGTRITAILQDLSVRHRFDLNRVEGFRGVWGGAAGFFAKGSS